MAEVERTSVASGDARRTPRVDFNAQVELLARDAGSDEQRVLVAQALDLCAGGIGLSMRERLPVGTKVTCRLALDGRDAALGGRVAWSRANTSPRPHGLGVCFDGLDEQERDLLAHVVDRTQAGYRPIELRFEGMQTPLIARACPTADGLRVSTPLPMLNQGAELSVRFEGEGQAFIGRVTDVVVAEEDGTRRLEVALALSDAASVRFRRQARYGYANELTSAVGSDEPGEDATSTGRHPARSRRKAASAHAPVLAREPMLEREPNPAPESTRASQTEADPDLQHEFEFDPAVPRPRAWRAIGRVLRIAASLVLAAACGALLSAWIERVWSSSESESESGAESESREPQPEPSAEPEPAASPIEGARVGVPNVLPSISPDGEFARARGAEEIDTPARTLSDSTEPSALAAEPVPANQTSQASSTPIGGEATKAATALKPAVSASDGVTIVTVPYAGSLDGMETRTWASPPAVAIDLPHGRALIAHGYYSLSGGIVAGLRVRERNGQLLVRVMLAQPVSRIAVSAQRESLEVRLTTQL